MGYGPVCIPTADRGNEKKARRKSTIAKKLTAQEKRALTDARNLIIAIERKDSNEAETRRRVERIFENIMGYDPYVHLSRERAVHGAGDTEHVDFAIQLEDGTDVPPIIMVELKRVGIDLAPKHIKQASRYAVDAGCEWVLLTNGRDWRVYHIEFGQPPITKLVEQWNLLKDDLDILADKFSLICLRRVKKGILDTLWDRTKVLAPDSLLRAILSHDSIRALRRVLKRDTGVKVSADHIVSGLRKILNENAATILDNVEISIPAPAKKNKRKPKQSGPEPNSGDLAQNDNVVEAETTATQPQPTDSVADETVKSHNSRRSGLNATVCVSRMAECPPVVVVGRSE
jgi:hypothetical protein